VSKRVQKTIDQSPPGSLQLASGKTARAYTNVQGQEILANKEESPGGKRCKKHHCKQCIVFFPEFPEWTADAEVEVECRLFEVVVASSAAQVFGPKPLGVTKWQHSNPLVEPRSERYKQRKQPTRHISKQSRNFFAFVIRCAAKVRSPHVGNV